MLNGRKFSLFSGLHFPEFQLSVKAVTTSLAGTSWTWLNIYCNRLIFDDFVLWIVGQINITNFFLYLIFFSPGVRWRITIYSQLTQKISLITRYWLLNFVCIKIANQTLLVVANVKLHYWVRKLNQKENVWLDILCKKWHTLWVFCM